MRIDDIDIGEVYHARYHADPLKALAIERVPESYGGRLVRKVKVQHLDPHTLEPVNRIERKKVDDEWVSTDTGELHISHLPARDINEPWAGYIERHVAAREQRRREKAIEGHVLAALDHALGFDVTSGDMRVTTSYHYREGARPRGPEVVLFGPAVERLLEVVGADPIPKDTLAGEYRISLAES